MAYSSLEACLLDLEKRGDLVRVREEVDPYLEMAAIHLRIHEQGGPAILFEKVKGSRFRAASNIFGTLERSKYIFRDQLKSVETLIALRNNPMKALKNPFAMIGNGIHALKALPLKNPLTKSVLFQEIKITELPLIHHWHDDGGAFVTLPQVYTEDADYPGIMQSNLGMYRIQLTGNEYQTNKEIGLHYQLHRGIGIHQTKAHKKNQPLKVSVFVGGPPAHTVAAVMPLPEGMSELTFAGILGGRRFRYVYEDGFCVSTDADFVITGEVYPNENKPEGPFGDHLGYYSLQHPFPMMQVHKVYARKNAIWPFTVVGRPPQEDTSFGALIHAMTGDAIKHEIPGVKQIHAVDAAGVHPLLLAVGSERYTPYLENKKPAEILTQANRILGTGQLSLAKYLFITASDDTLPDAHDLENYFKYIFERIDTENDLHFHTRTTIDTLDYSGEGLNSGSKLVLAAYGEKKRELSTNIPEEWKNLDAVKNIRVVMPGVIAIETEGFADYNRTQAWANSLTEQMMSSNKYNENESIVNRSGIVMMVLCDDADFVSKNLNNFLWVTFTRSNPSHDVYGIASSVQHKHWGCKGPVIIDARKKPHHAPEMIKDPAIEKRVDRLFEQGGSLHGL